MTIDSSTAVATYNGDNSTTVFAYPFRILAEGHVLVQLKDANDVYTTQAITTDYTVSGVGSSSGGNITFITAPASTETVILTRAMPFTQDTDYTANDLFPAEAHEEALDELTMMCQQLKEEVGRCIRVGNDAGDSASKLLPDPADYTGKYLRWNSAGTALEAVTIDSFTGVTGFLDEDDMASDSATAAASQQSIKAYVDNQLASGGLWANAVLGSDQTTTSTSDVNITGLNFTPAASSTYEFRAHLVVQTTDNSDAPVIGFDWNTGVSNGGVVMRALDATGSYTSEDDTYYGPAGTDVSGFGCNTLNADEDTLAIIEGTFTTTGSPSGNFQLVFASGDASTTATIKAGSWLSYRKLA